MTDTCAADITLRRCPHCGCKAIYKKRLVGMWREEDTYWRAECTSCSCNSKEFYQDPYLKDGGSEARRLVAENWNRRTRKAV